MVRILEKPRKDILPLFAVGTFGLNLLALGVLTFQGVSLGLMANRPAPTLVQLQDGSAVAVKALDHFDRPAETIRRFTKETMTLLLNWRGTLPPESEAEALAPRPDAGVQISGGKIATSTWAAGFALSEQLRPTLLETLAKLTPQGIFTSGSRKPGETSQVTLVIRYLSEPEKVDEHRWKVKMIANLLSFTSGNRLGKAIPFNKDIFIEAVEPPLKPTGGTAVEQQIFKVRQAGLEIYAIRDLEKENL